MLGVDSGIRLKVVQSARGSPRPGSQCAPVLRLSWLPFVDQTDDSARDSCSIIGLDAGGIEECESPTSRNQLPRVGQSAILIQLRKLKRGSLDRLPRGMLLEDLLQRRIL